MSKSVPDDSQEVETSRPERQAGTGLTRERIAELARMQASHVTRPVGGKEIPRTEGRLPEVPCSRTATAFWRWSGPEG